MNISILYARQDKTTDISVEIDSPCTIEQAIRASNILEQQPEINMDSISVGIYGKKKTLSTELEDGDRVEIYRPLKIDPKQARLLRAKKSPTEPKR